MDLKSKFVTYQELADILGCSYQLVVQKHAKNIIETYNIDKKRLPKAGTLPVELVEQYFDFSIDINKNEKTI